MCESGCRPRAQAAAEAAGPNGLPSALAEHAKASARLMARITNVRSALDSVRELREVCAARGGHRSLPGGDALALQLRARYRAAAARSANDPVHAAEEFVALVSVHAHSRAHPPPWLNALAQEGCVREREDNVLDFRRAAVTQRLHRDIKGWLVSLSTALQEGCARSAELQTLDGSLVLRLQRNAALSYNAVLLVSATAPVVEHLSSTLMRFMEALVVAPGCDEHESGDAKDAVVVTFSVATGAARSRLPLQLLADAPGQAQQQAAETLQRVQRVLERVAHVLFERDAGRARFLGAVGALLWRPLATLLQDRVLAVR
jgi:hypothetical protein